MKIPSILWKRKSKKTPIKRVKGLRVRTGVKAGFIGGVFRD